MKDRLLPETLKLLREKITRETGLDFSPPKDRDLEVRNAVAAKDFGFSDPESFARWALPLSKEQSERWTDSLTVGETYFRREPEVFEALEEEILPALAANNKSSRRLRIWCAGCSTGEEVYSLAISLKRARFDFRNWDVTILGTDLNGASLKKAEAGVYGSWSFRNTPDWFREEYFIDRSDNVWEVRPELRQGITFFPLNLIDDFLGPEGRPLSDFDLVLCRNVLMYFGRDTARAVLRAFEGCLADSGLLLVSASELSLKGLEDFDSVPVSRSLAFKKASGPSAIAVSAATRATPVSRRQERPRKAKVSKSQGARYAELPPDLNNARILADQGRWSEALDLCHQALKGRELDPSAHYLIAVVYMEMERPEEAVQALQKAVYLDPSHLLAHFSLGHLLRNMGLTKASNKCFENALEVDLGPAEQILPESDGLTVGQFRELVRQSLQEGDSA